MLIMFMITKIQGVEAQESLITTKTKTEKEIQNITKKEIKNPKELVNVLSNDPYEHSSKKKADEELVIYRKELDEERRKREEEQRKELESKKNKIVLAKKVVAMNVEQRGGDFTEIYQKAAQMFGIDWQLLRAVHIVETGGSGDTTRGSYAGAQGPMQFMPSTFRAYGIDGDGDGVKNIYDVDDAIFSAANYLSQNRAGTDVRSALLRYNHSNAYVEKVLSIARSLGLSK